MAAEATEGRADAPALRPAVGYIAALAAAVTFGGVNVAAKVALRTTHPVTAVAVTFGASALVFLPFAWSFRPRLRDLPLVLTSATVGGSLAALALYHGLARLPASTASLLLTSEMVFTALLALVFLGERPPRGEWPGLALLASAAVAAAVGHGVGPVAGLAGVLLALTAAFCWGVDNNINVPLSRRYDVRHLVAARGVLGGAVAVGLALVVGAPLEVERTALVILVAAGLVGVGVSTSFYYLALRHIGATRAVVVFTTAGVWGALAAFVALREPLGWHHLVAVVLASAGFLVLWRAARRAPA